MKIRIRLVVGVALGCILAGSIINARQVDKDFGSYKAKEIRKSDVWLNSKPLTLKSLRGKVVVIDFWAFDCESCIQAMPQVVALYDKYGKEGVAFIGIH